jgi:hypothetical protein
MTTSTTLFRLLAAAALTVYIAACSSAPVAPSPATAPKLQDMLTRASEAASAGQKEQAVTLWKAAAAAHPTDKTAYGHIAKTRFDAAQYGEAIVNAQEVLVRDPNDKQASSIIATSGLRLATRALSDLSRQNGLSGSLHKESMELARLLRDSLGRDDLFKNDTPEKSNYKDRTKAARDAGAKVKKEVKDDCKPGDPFCALK